MPMMSRMKVMCTSMGICHMEPILKEYFIYERVIGGRLLVFRMEELVVWKVAFLV